MRNLTIPRAPKDPKSPKAKDPKEKSPKEKSSKAETPRDTPMKHVSNSIILGDCLIELKKLPVGSIDLVVTDPPYFLDGLDNAWDAKTLQKKQQKAGVIGGLPVGMKFDPAQGKRFEAFYREVSRCLHRVLKPGGYFLSFSQPRLFHRMAIAVEDAGFEIRDQYAWHYTKKSQMKAFSMDHFVEKKNLDRTQKEAMKKKLMGRKTPQLRPQFESILLAQKPREGTFIDNWIQYKTGLIDTSILLNSQTPSTVMEVEKPSKETYNCHLTVKPVRLIEHLINIFSLRGQVVLDPFMGSGTTALACHNTGRHYMGMEVNEDYVTIAQKRLQHKMPLHAHAST